MRTDVIDGVQSFFAYQAADPLKEFLLARM